MSRVPGITSRIVHLVMRVFWNCEMPGVSGLTMRPEHCNGENPHIAQGAKRN